MYKSTSRFLPSIQEIQSHNVKVGVSNNATCDDLSTKWFESDKQVNRARQNSFGRIVSDLWKSNFEM